MEVPFLDLKAQYREIREEIGAAIQDVLDNTAFAGGPFVEKFEREFAEYCGARFGVGVGSGTDALWVALLALEVGPGDEVITVSNTFFATVEAILACGAKPVFVDIDEETYTIDPARIEAAITPRTKGIIPVHLYGQMADMDPILSLARARGLFVVEDAAQAQGAEYKGHRAGTMGAAGCFSFYPGKNLGAYGEAGAVVTDNPDLNEKMRVIRDHGQPKKYTHARFGWNARMDGIQGAVLSVKLARLDEWNNSRRANAAIYDKLLSGQADVRTPVEASYARHIYHVYEIRHPRRDALLKALGDAGIHAAIHYPNPLHLQGACANLNYVEGSLPVTERCAREILSLPMYPELRREQIEHVAREVSQFSAASQPRQAVGAR